MLYDISHSSHISHLGRVDSSYGLNLVQDGLSHTLYESQL